MSSDLHWQDATEISRRIRGREIAASEVLEHFLARIERLNPVLNCVVAIDKAAARTRAAEADAAIARGEIWGPLHGVPMTIKDTIEVAGLPCTAGSEILKDHIPTRHATAVQSLVDAGAVIFGKTNVPEFGADLQTINKVYGTTGNAWNPERLAGGSSGGAAVSLAAGLTALELGSDIGGSTRNPAHYNSIFGMRPTWGTIPIRGHIPGMPGSLVIDEFGTLGPLARSARDLRLAFDIVRGGEPMFGYAGKPALPESPITDVGQLRVGVWLEGPSVAAMDTEVLAILNAAVDKLRYAGVKQLEFSKPDFDPLQAYLTYIRIGAAVTGSGTPPEQREEMRKELATLERAADAGDSYLHRLRGVLSTYADFVHDSQLRGENRVKWNEYFQQYDVVLSPVMGVAALPHGENFFRRTITVNGKQSSGRDQLFWCALQVLASLPSVVCPAGFTKEGLPVGIQITAPYLQDYRPIRVAELFAPILGADGRHPRYPCD